MPNPSYEVDPSLRGEFLDESLDALRAAARDFVALERNPADIAPLHAIYRAFHSIKGNAAYFQLMEVKRLAHAAESLLSLLREGRLSAEGEILAALLSALDSLSAMLARVREGAPEVAEPAALEALVDRLRGAADAGSPEARSRTLAELDEALQRLRSDPLFAGSPPKEVERIGALLRRLAGIAGKSQAKPAAAPPVAAEIETILSVSDPGALSASAMEDLRQRLQSLQKHVAGTPDAPLAEEILSDFEACALTVGIDPLIREALLDKIRKLSGAPRPAATVGAGATGANEAAPGGTEKTMRVRESAVDGFLQYVGELIGIQEAYEHIRTCLDSDADTRRASEELRRANDGFQALSQRLQRSIMDVRRIPVGRILQRIPRVIRDVASARGKEIEVALEGESLLVDKSILDALEAPLMHMARNAADHGVETPEVRRQRGKAPSGHVRVAVAETGDRVLLEVADDGGGLNLEALARKAESLGMISVGAALAEPQIVDLLFAPGVSTAEAVSDISGRGVGMDVVKRAIDAMGGRIRIENRPGLGCTFTIDIPRSVGTQILHVFMVGVGGIRFGVPMGHVLRCFDPSQRQKTTLPGGGRTITDEGRQIPLISLRAALNLPERAAAGGPEHVLVVLARDRHLALEVDEILGVRQVVLKTLAQQVNADGIFLGAATLGDGGIAMIMDAGKLCASTGRVPSPRPGDGKS